MNPCKTEQEYIDQIYLAAQKACARYSYLPSVLIAQACVENGYGIPDYWDNPQISLLVKYWNMVGIKSELLNKSWTDIGLSVWNGESLTKQTPEIYGGKKVIITDNFRKYNSAEESFVDFLLFLTYASNYGAGGKPKYGREVLDIKDPEKLITEVNRRGYTTGTTYPSSVMKIIKKHNLTKYDSIVGIKPTELIPPALQKSEDKKDDSKMSISINKKYLTTNNSYSTNNPIAIVIHNTDNYAASADAKAHAEWIATDTNTGMSWHYVVDDHSIYQNLPHNRGAYHVGKNYGSNNLFSKYGGRDNKNTIGIEMCVNAGFNYEKAFQNTVALTKYLMKELNIPAERVFQHYDICSKNCPSEIRKRNDWGRFKSLISNGSSSSVTPSTPTVPDTEKYHYKVRKVGTDEKTQIEADEILDNAKKTANKNRGYKVFDSNKNYECVYDPFRWKFLDSCQAVMDKARTEGWHYGDSHATPPCSDKTISCDRLIARALYDLGYKDQRTGGETCGTLDSWLPAHGFKKVTNTSDILPGAVVAVRNKNQSYINHVFVVETYNSKTAMCTKYDAGGNNLIQMKQPVSYPLLMWSDRVFVAAWNPPETATSPSEPDQKEDTSGIVFPTTFNCIDYKLVYNYTFYKKKYADLQQAFGNDKNAYFEHFCVYGMKEGRQAKSTFDVQKYKNRYEDLRKAFGNNLPAYYKHYIQYGKREGRKAT